MPPSTTANTSESLRALMLGAIDYAGLFPPARLPLDRAWPNYLEYRASADRWMLSHFIIPAVQLDALAAHAPSMLAASEPITLSVLCQGGVKVRHWLDLLVEDAQAIGRFLDATDGHVAIAALEGKLPDELAGEHANAKRTADFAALVTEALHEAGLGSATLFLEVALADDWQKPLAEQIAGLACAAQLPHTNLGMKFRTGGLQAQAFPSCEQLAGVVAGCARERLAWKATAGLHHPVRQHRREVNAPMHGFINVLAASVLAAAHGLSAEELAPILLDEEANHFRFDERSLAWQDRAATVDQIESARRGGLISFGSCSFDEPRDELRELGWLA